MRRQSAAVAKPKADDVLLEFNTDYLNLKQFLNLISNFIEPAVLHSEAFVNDLIVFLKDNYSESQAEKNAKLDKVWLKVYIQMKLRKTTTFLPTKKGCIWEKTWPATREIGEQLWEIGQRGQRSIAHWFCGQCVGKF